MRINKYLAECGVASRRRSDDLVKDGCVTVNGKVATVGSEADERDAVAVNGVLIKKPQKKVVYLLNKPKGYVTTVKDDKDRPTVMRLLPETDYRLFPVGRLDYDTEGMLLLTNDGELAFRLTHPKNEIPKTYLVKVEGRLSDEMLAKLRQGVEIDGVKTQKANVKLVESDKDHTKLHVTITEGKNRQIRKMFEAVGKDVVFLKRIKIGDLTLRGMDRGTCRKLSEEEAEYLRNL